MKRALLPVVEGDGDLRAIPVLMRRILHTNGIFDVPVLHPHLRGDLPKVRSQFERFLQVATKEDAPIIWTADYDCDNCACAASEAAAFGNRAKAVVGSWPIEFCFFIQEFETVFLSTPASVRQYFDLSAPVAISVNPEEVRDAKGTISRLLPKGNSYKPTIHQAGLCSVVDLGTARTTSPSYAHFERAVLRLAAVVQNQ